MNPNNESDPAAHAPVNTAGDMRAVRVTRYGGPEVLEVATMPRPAPAAGEVLVRTAWGAVNAADRRLMRADPWLVRLAFGLRRPRFEVLGMALAGTVAESDDPAVPVGTRVAADLSDAGCRAFGEYVAVQVRDLAVVPASLSLDQAATLPLAGTTALQALRDQAHVAAGDRVLVTGASGAVGMMAVAIAHDLGATVWALTASERGATVRNAGAHEVVDRETTDIVMYARERDVQFDAIIDTAGTGPLSDFAPILAPTGTYVLVGGSVGRLLSTAITGPIRSRRAGASWRTFTASASATDLTYLIDRAAAGAIVAPIGARFPLEEAAEALSAAEQHTVHGRILIDMGTTNTTTLPTPR
jgi:NADPH:quinone reductase-like Zn-dependent oxidoreductase